MVLNALGGPAATTVPTNLSHGPEVGRPSPERPPLVLIGLILQEFLQGLRFRAQFDQILRALAAFPVIEPNAQISRFLAEDWIDPEDGGSGSPPSQSTIRG